MNDFDCSLPPLLAELHKLEFDYADDDGIAFMPFETFQSATENASWFRAWTGNPAVDAHEYRVFGQDGSGGLAAFWLVRDGAPLLAQPIAFFGSGGDFGVIAQSFSDYLWLLAEGVGPWEAVERMWERRPAPDLADFAARNATTAKRAPRAVVAAAAEEFPNFERDVRALTR